MCEAISIPLASLVCAVIYRDLHLAVSPYARSTSAEACFYPFVLSCIPPIGAYHIAAFLVWTLGERFLFVTHNAACRDITALVAFHVTWYQEDIATAIGMYLAVMLSPQELLLFSPKKHTRVSTAEPAENARSVSMSNAQLDANGGSARIFWQSAVCN